MDKIKVPVESNILQLVPKGANGSSRKRSKGALVLEPLAKGRTLDSSWSSVKINMAFKQANKIWGKAKIEFIAAAAKKRSLEVPADEDGMWITFINKLSPKKGLSASFVFDLPSNEGGWGGGRIAIIAGEKVKKGLETFGGRVLAHELGHCLLGMDHETEQPSNLMFDRMHPRVASANLLTPDQVNRARAKAAKLI